MNAPEATERPRPGLRQRLAHAWPEWRESPGMRTIAAGSLVYAFVLFAVAPVWIAFMCVVLPVAIFAVQLGYLGARQHWRTSRTRRSDRP